jgi:hypothetical protein
VGDFELIFSYLQRRRKVFIVGLGFYLQVAGKSMDILSSVEQMIVMDEHVIQLEVKKYGSRRKMGTQTQAATIRNEEITRAKKRTCY